jgi:opacity protein-like surface antigen
MKRALAATAAAITISILASASSASAGNLQLRVGGFFPRVDSKLFADDTSLYATDASGRPVKKSDWTGVAGGAEYSSPLGRNVELGFHIDGYGRALDTFYNDYARPSGGEIRQTLTFSEVPVGFTVRFIGGGKHSAVRPYVGAGADVIFWQYDEEGSFIDFADDSFPIIDDHFRAKGAALGGHVAAGLRVALSHDVGLTAEGRYLVGPKKEMGDDFSRNQIDLSGASATVGFYVNF